MDDTRQNASIEDEDPDDQIVNDANILAEVRLSSTIRMLGSLSLSFPNLSDHNLQDTGGLSLQPRKILNCRHSQSWSGNFFTTNFILIL
jgi:hypothetical protein